MQAFNFSIPKAELEVKSFYIKEVYINYMNCNFFCKESK